MLETYSDFHEILNIILGSSIIILLVVKNEDYLAVKLSSNFFVVNSFCIKNKPIDDKLFS